MLDKIKQSLAFKGKYYLSFVNVFFLQKTEKKITPLLPSSKIENTEANVWPQDL